MKKIIILLVILVSIITACNTHKEQNTIELPYSFKLKTIGNHQYLLYSNGYADGLCHYEDCSYCLKHKNYGKD